MRDMPALSATSDAPYGARGSERPRSVSEAAQALIRQAALELLPEMLERAIAEERERITREVIERIDMDALAERMDARMPRVNYFGGMTQVGNIGADAVDFSPAITPKRLFANLGDNVTAWSVTTPQLVDIRRGTSALPDTTQNPIVKVSRTVQMSATGIAPSDGSDYAAGVLSVVSGTAANQVQTVGVVGYARSVSTSNVTNGADDACGIYGVGRITNSGTGVGIGGYINGRRDTSTGKACGVEIRCTNATNSAGSYNSTGFTQTTGIYLNADGNAGIDSGIGLCIDHVIDNQFKVGIGFTGTVTNGKTGGIADSSIRDDGGSSISLDIRGAHSTAAISVANGSGAVLLSSGNTTTAPFRIPHGVAPSAPVDGDMWTTSAGLFVRINGSTVGPLS